MTIQDEFAFINQIKPKSQHQPSLVQGIGDDAAVFYPSVNTGQIICTDTLVEDVHFSNKTMTPYQIGYKALAVNISDIAAMGGYPSFYLVSIAIPSSWIESDLLSIYKGMQDIADLYKIDLIGGDTVSSHHSLMITVTIIGQTEKGRHLLRKNARDGDVVFVTGTLGDSAAGLELLLTHSKEHTYTSDEEFLVKRHQMPDPRIKVGQFLSGFHRVSLNDVSDGIASEANEIAEASGVSLFLEAEWIPVSQQLIGYNKERLLEFALFGGEDFELIGTMSEKEWNSIETKSSYSLTKIGYVKSGKPEVFLHKDDKIITLEKKGYNHFKK